MEARPAPEVVLAVWEAEDGRCEACKRPMDKRLARVARLDDHGPQSFENLQLLCVDCKAYRPDPLVRLSVSEAIAKQIVGSLGPEQAEQAMAWLRGQLQRYGVLVALYKTGRRYWLPGVTTFEVALDADGSAAVSGVGRIPPQPAVRVKPQAHTRGLPAPTRQPVATRKSTGAMATR